MLFFSFLRNSYMHVRILLFPFEFCYSLFRFYYAIKNSFIQFRILLFAFEFCYAVLQFCNSIVQSSHAVSDPNISFPILLFTFPILLCQYQFCYSLSIYVLPNPGLHVINYTFPAFSVKYGNICHIYLTWTIRVRLEVQGVQVPEAHAKEHWTCLELCRIF